MALTKCNVPKDVIGSLGTNPSERGLTTQQFKDKFDEMPEGIIDYLNNTLTEELDPVVGKVATLSNKNILHNWDFRNPVNQRGQSSYTGVGYTIDCWYNASTKTILIQEGAVVLPADMDEFWGFRGELYKVNVGDTVTISVMIGGEIKHVTTTVNDTWADIEIDTNLRARIVKYVAGGFFVCGLKNTSPSNSVALQAAKLEKGPVSTLAYDPPADYGEELRKCQRYLMAYGQYAQWRAVYFQPNFIDFSITVPQNMRISPTIVNGNNLAVILSGAVQTGFTFSVAAASGNNLRLRALKTSHGLTDAYIECSGIVLFSAEL